MIDFILSLFHSEEPKIPPKYRLKPAGDGLYNLEMWHDSIKMYIAESVGMTKDSADKYIKNIERDVIYYREE